MYTEEDSDRYIAKCFVNGLYASDGEINLEKNDNLISNDNAFIINLEEDEFEPGLIFGRSFLRSANVVVNFGEGTITIQPDFDPFLLSSDEEKNPNLDDLETLLDFDFDEAPQTETDLSPLVCKMGKGSRNKKKVMENIMYFNNGTGPSTSVGIPLTQEEAEKRALAYNISMRLDGMIKPEEERVMVKVKGQMLKEKKDPRAFLFLIRLEGRINENALADTSSGVRLNKIEANKMKSKEGTEESSKRTEDELESDKSKKAESSEKKAEGSRKKSIDEHEEAKEDDKAEVKKHMEVVQDDEEIAIDAIPLATKPSIIIEYKIVKEGQKGFYHLIRADGSSNRYSSMIRMLQNISREDLETLWKLVKTKHGNTRPEDVYEKVF
ncbi:hypothetical protein Tco_0362779 [Tanacetum coccineum]